MCRLRTYISLWSLFLPPTIARYCHPPYSYIATSLILGSWDSDLSVLSVDADATTYIEDYRRPGTTICDIEFYDSNTFVNGPSTAGVTFIRTACGTLDYISINYECPLSEPNTATCTYFINGTAMGTVTQNSSEMSPVPVTIFAGIEKLSLAPVTAIITSDSNCTSSPTTSTGTPTQTSPPITLQSPTSTPATALSPTSAVQSPTPTSAAALSNSPALSSKIFMVAAFAGVFSSWSLLW